MSNQEENARESLLRETLQTESYLSFKAELKKQCLEELQAVKSSSIRSKKKSVVFVALSGIAAVLLLSTFVFFLTRSSDEKLSVKKVVWKENHSKIEGHLVAVQKKLEAELITNVNVDTSDYLIDSKPIALDRLLFVANVDDLPESIYIKTDQDIAVEYLETDELKNYIKGSFAIVGLPDGSQRIVYLNRKDSK